MGLSPHNVSASATPRTTTLLPCGPAVARRPVANALSDGEDEAADIRLSGSQERRRHRANQKGYVARGCGAWCRRNDTASGSENRSCGRGGICRATPRRHLNCGQFRHRQVDTRHRIDRERMAERRFEFCVFDQPKATILPNLKVRCRSAIAKLPPNVDEGLKLLKEGRTVTSSSIPKVWHWRTGPSFFAKLLPRIAELRARTGRPHWLPRRRGPSPAPGIAPEHPAQEVLPENLPSTIYITVHPEAVFARSVEDGGGCDRIG